jgi:density-regulated protein DRP1
MDTNFARQLAAKMADFVEDDVKGAGEEGGEENLKSVGGMIDFNSPVDVIYCPTCTMPCEFCEHGACFDKCLPWILKNCPEVLSETVLAEMVAKTSIGDDEPQVGHKFFCYSTALNFMSDMRGDLQGEVKKEKKKGGGAAAPKKATVLDTKVIITKVQRQKRKYVTVVGGLETVPDLKIKDASRVFGKKFSSGCSVNESQTGAKEVVIQGDVLFDLPAILMTEFKVPAEAIFILEDGSLRPFR